MSTRTREYPRQRYVQEQCEPALALALALALARKNILDMPIPSRLVIAAWDHGGSVDAKGIASVPLALPTSTRNPR